jgi:hypothetical protein
LKPVLAALGARHMLDAVFAVDGQFVADARHGYAVHDGVAQRVARALVDSPFAWRHACDAPTRSVALAA